MQGLEFTSPVGPIIERCLSAGLVLINAGPNIIRFVPPLVITKSDVDAMLSILEKCI
jgi:acetylornithine/N-succinyldiaminopimelate aminotransferase